MIMKKMKLHLALSATVEKKDDIESPYQCTIVISIAFFFVFSAFMSLQALQSSLNMTEGLGTKSLASIYAGSIISSSLGPLVLKLIGGKLCVIAAFFVHVIYVCSNFYPRFETLIPSSLLLGLVTGPLWISQGLFLTASANQISKTKNKLLEHTLSKVNGIFFALMGLAFTVGSIVSSIIFRDEVYSEEENITYPCGVLMKVEGTRDHNATRSITTPSKETLYQLMAAYLTFDVIGVILVVLFLPPLPKSKRTKNRSIAKSFCSMFTAMVDVKLLLFLPYSISTSIMLLIVYADFTKAYISCRYGISMVGYVMGAFAVSNTIFLQILPKTVKYLPRKLDVAFATIISVVNLIIWIFWDPSFQYLSLIFISSISMGFTDSVFKLDTFGIIPMLFPETMDTTFANVHFWRGFWYALVFGTASYISVYTRLVFCISFAVVSITLYGILHSLWSRKSFNKPNEETTIKVEDEMKPIDRETNVPEEIFNDCNDTLIKNT